MSARAWRNGLPVSAASASESSSWCSATARDSFISSRPRSTPLSLPQAPSIAARAAFTAASMSAAPPRAIAPIVWPSLGLMTAMVSRVAGGVQSPPIRMSLRVRVADAVIGASLAGDPSLAPRREKPRLDRAAPRADHRRMRIFGFFEALLVPTALPPEAPPPSGLLAFYWHYARQARGLVALLFLAGLVVATLDSTIPVFIGRVVTLVSSHAPGALPRDAGMQLLAMALVILVLRPSALFLQNLVTNQAIAAGLSNMIRWQSHFHVVRQSWTFFQNDFAGRIANRVMQTGPALRESVVSATNAVWYILVYGGSAIALMGANDLRLTIPVVLWFAGYAILLRVFVPRLRDSSRRMSEVRSALTGRIVDSYTNILTVKLFARPRDEDAFVRETVDEHTAAFLRQLRLITLFGTSLATLNATMVVSTGAVALWLWSGGHISVGIIAMALPLTWQIANIAGWVAQNVTA